MRCLTIAAVGVALMLTALGCDSDKALKSSGVRVVLEPDATVVASLPEFDFEETLHLTAEIIERRLDDYDGPPGEVRQENGNRLLVELQGVDLNDASIHLVAAAAALEFREQKLDDAGDVFVCQDGVVTYSPPGCEGGEEVAVPFQSLTIDMLETVVWIPAHATDSDGVEKDLTGRFLKPNTYVASDPITGWPEVRFEMTSEGARLLSKVTERLVGLPMAFFLDGEPIRGEDGRIIAPIVQSVLSDQSRITGLRFEDARLLSIQLNAGAFPVPLKIVETEELSN